jgi:hypothetical protein
MSRTIQWRVIGSGGIARRRTILEGLASGVRSQCVPSVCYESACTGKAVDVV